MTDNLHELTNDEVDVLREIYRWQFDGPLLLSDTPPEAIIRWDIDKSEPLDSVPDYLICEVLWMRPNRLRVVTKALGWMGMLTSQAMNKLVEGAWCFRHAYAPDENTFWISAEARESDRIVISKRDFWSAEDTETTEWCMRGCAEYALTPDGFKHARRFFLEYARKGRVISPRARSAPIPPLDTKSGDWIIAAALAEEMSVASGTLSTYRSKGTKADDLDSGMDMFGRAWRREKSNSNRIWYLRKSLQRN